MVNELGEYPTTVDMEPIELAGMNWSEGIKKLDNLATTLLRSGITPDGWKEKYDALLALGLKENQGKFEWAFENLQNVINDTVLLESQLALKELKKNKESGYVAPEWQHWLQRALMKELDVDDRIVRWLLSFTDLKNLYPMNECATASMPKPDMRTFDLNGRQVVMDVANEPGIGVLETGEVVYGANVSDEEMENFRRWVNGEAVTNTGNELNEEKKVVPRDYRIVDVTDEMERFFSKIEEEYKDVNLLGEAEKLALFYRVVKNNSIGDIKMYDDILKGDLYIYNGEIVNRDTLGNIAYGYLGKHFGITNALLAVAPGLYDIAQSLRSKDDTKENEEKRGGFKGFVDKLKKIKFNWLPTFFDEPRDYARVQQGERLWYDRH